MFAPLDNPTALRLAELFAALADPSRLRIIAALAAAAPADACSREVNVGDLALAVGLSKSAISHQLRGLRARRIVRSRKQGRQVFVALDDDHIADLFRRGLAHISHP